MSSSRQTHLSWADSIFQNIQLKHTFWIIETPTNKNPTKAKNGPRDSSGPKKNNHVIKRLNQFQSGRWLGPNKYGLGCKSATSVWWHPNQGSTDRNRLAPDQDSWSYDQTRPEPEKFRNLGPDRAKLRKLGPRPKK